jgi:hypothetical protein
VKALAVRRAKAEDRSLANYLEQLIVADAKTGGNPALAVAAGAFAALAGVWAGKRHTGSRPDAPRRRNHIR